MSSITKPIILDETGKRIANALEAMSRSEVELEFDGTEYTGIEKWLAKRQDGMPYSVVEPKWSDSNMSSCTKTGANAGLSATPSTATESMRDDYRGIHMFECHDCNAWLDENGRQHVYAIKGQDERYSPDPMLSPTGVQMDVCVLTPIIYYGFQESAAANLHTWSDTHINGTAPQPHALYEDGTERGYMLYAKYAGVKDGAGKLRSASGYPLWTRDYSHNTSHTYASNRGVGYSGKTIADDWYVKSMMMLKYGTKNSQTVFAGCTSYYLDYIVAFSEKDTNRVIVTDAEGVDILIGSSIMCSNDENRGGQVFDARRVLAKELLTGDKAGYTALIVEGAPFSIEAGKHVATAPYHSGYCDSVKGVDGSPVNCKSGKEPFLLQNIECMVGAYEILSDVILEGSPGQEVHVCYDSSKYSTTITEDYVKIGSFSGTPNKLNIECEYKYLGGVLMPQGSSASSSTGIGDGWHLPASSTLLYGWLGVGDLYYGPFAGLAYVCGYYGLTRAYWFIAGRISLTGRSRA